MATDVLGVVLYAAVVAGVSAAALHCIPYPETPSRKEPAVRRTALTLAAALAVVFGWAGTASAGSPHVPDTKVTATVDGATLTVAFKEAGLGDETQIAVQVTATAHCVNPGGNPPQAGNKATFAADATVPVQNGKAEGTLSVTAVFQPPCSPPMSVEFSDVTVTDETSGITTSLSGTF